MTRRSIATARFQSFRYSPLICPSILPAAFSWKHRVTPTFLTSSLHTTLKMEPPRVQANGEGQNKRKSPIVIVGRPAKLPKTDIIGRTEKSSSSDNDLGMEMSDDGRLPTIAPVLADSVEWQAAIEKVVRNVVSIHFCQTCPFDTDPAVSSEATGFVVDAERGYILTNRHVVGAGPFWGYCIFDNHEEVSA